jgi:hypothetical protein
MNHHQMMLRVCTSKVVEVMVESLEDPMFEQAFCANSVKCPAQTSSLSSILVPAQRRVSDLVFTSCSHCLVTAQSSLGLCQLMNQSTYDPENLHQPGDDADKLTPPLGCRDGVTAGNHLKMRGV